MKSKIYGVFLLFEAFFMFLTSLVAFYYHYQYGETDVAAFLASTMVTGILDLFFCQPVEKSMTNKEVVFISQI